jgi:small-conductance mechanosensitive channel
VIGFVIFDRRRNPHKTGEPSESLLHCAKESLRQVEHQIWLLRNVFWWYLLPSLVAIISFFVHVAWRIASDWWGVLAALSGPVLIGVVVNVVVYLVNRLAIRLDLEPRRQELLNLIAGLEDESNGKYSKDVIAIVSKLADPSQRFTWEKWADNWNNTVPSWRVAAAILVSTLLGAFCGLYSGLWIRIPEMGPVLFQTVVGAVIPSEIALFSFMYLASRRKKRRQAASATNDQNMPASEVVHQQSGDQKTKRLPRAPAIVILVLILFLSLMVIPAIISFFMYFTSEYPLIGKGV